MSQSLKHSTDDLSSHRHRQVIGYLGAMLPWLLLVVANRRPTVGLPSGVVLRSVSAYYYTSAVVAFVGVLAVLAVFLLTYRGYANAYRLHDRIAAAVAGVMAVLVIAFPTAPPDPLPRPIWWNEHTGWIHHAAAGTLFCAFAFFSLVLFTKSDQEQLSADKRKRNAVYLACGAAIVVCMLWALVAGLRGRPILLPEILALEFFAISWLAKGRAVWAARRVVEGTIHYGRHPKQLVSDVIQRLQPHAGKPGVPR